MKRSKSAFAALAVAVALAGCASWLRAPGEHARALAPEPDAKPVGWSECADCHTEIADFFDGWPGSDLDTDAHFFGDDVGERRFSQTSRSVEQNVVNAFFTLLGGLDKNIQIAFDFFLADIL